MQHILITDRLCVDLGAGFQTGTGTDAVDRLREAVLGRSDHRVKVIESYQMLGEIDEELRQALGFDVVGVHGSFTMFDGTPVPGDFNVTPTLRFQAGIEAQMADETRLADVSAFQFRV